MKHKFIFITIFVFISILSYSQSRQQRVNATSGIIEDRNFIVNDDVELKRYVDRIGLSVAKKLMKCCSSFGGNDIYSSIDYFLVKMNPKTGALIIPMTVGWYGSYSSRKYWIEGILVKNLNGSYKWVKRRDSGGFQSGCSNLCIR